MKRRLMLLGLAALPLAAIAQQGPGIDPAASRTARDGPCARSGDAGRPRRPRVGGVCARA